MKWIIGGLVVSLSLNIYGIGSIFRMKEIQNISYQKDSLISNGYDELVISHLNTIRDQNLETIKNQGRLEGIISVALNFKPEDNQHTAIWHAGYDHGSKTADYTRSVYYKEGYHKACKDLNCPAKGEESEADERRKKIERLKKDLDIFDKIDVIKTEEFVEN